MVNNYQKPFLKWLGGKSQIIEQIIKYIPNEINNYHEIFLGGGCVLLTVLSLQKEDKIKIKNKIYAYDLNSKLIQVFKYIQTNVEELYDILYRYNCEYNDIDGNIVIRNSSNIEDAKTSKESYYYWIRDKFNKMEKNTIECSALFIFLNKSCFRGMYREGPNGFNVPFGNYKKLSISSKEDFLNISKLIKNVEFLCLDFNDSLKTIKKLDFVYLDPPYVPENKNSFVNYNKEGFGEEQHKNLFDIVNNLKKNINFVLNNSNVELVLESFKKFNINEISAKRAINSKNPEATTKEVIITNMN
jgi:DNA adenine methylase